MNPVVYGATVIAAIAAIGGSALKLDRMHVASEDFRQYIEQQQAADEKDYVLELKEHIREIRYALISHPDSEYLLNDLADLTSELCEVRPNDRLCETG